MHKYLGDAIDDKTKQDSPPQMLQEFMTKFRQIYPSNTDEATCCLRSVNDVLLSDSGIVSGGIVASSQTLRSRTQEEDVLLFLDFCVAHRPRQNSERITTNLLLYYFLFTSNLARPRPQHCHWSVSSCDLILSRTLSPSTAWPLPYRLLVEPEVNVNT